LKPFLYDVSPIEAKKIIDDLPHDAVKQLVYRKGLVNFLPSKVCSVVKDNINDNTACLKMTAINDAASFSGSTKSDDGLKRMGRERMFSFDESDGHSSIQKSFREVSMDKISSNPVKKLGVSSFNPQMYEAGGEVDIFNLRDDVRLNAQKQANPVDIMFEIEEEKLDNDSIFKQQTMKKLGTVADSINENMIHTVE